MLDGTLRPNCTALQNGKQEKILQCETIWPNLGLRLFFIYFAPPIDTMRQIRHTTYMDRTNTMDEQDVKDILDATDEDAEFTDAELCEMFEAVYERQPDAVDREAGLFSLICAGVL